MAKFIYVFIFKKGGVKTKVEAVKSYFGIVLVVGIITTIASTVVHVYGNEGKSTPTMVYVDDDYDSSTPGWGIDHFASIQDAIDNASNGDAIKIYPGEYEPIVINKKIQLMGDPIIDGHGGIGIRIETSDVLVENMTIFNCSTGIYVHNSSLTLHNVTVKNCTVYNCIYGDKRGIYFYNVEDGNIINCSVYNNSYNILATYFSNGNIRGCSTYNGSEGIWVSHSSSTNIENCNAHNNTINGFYLSPYFSDGMVKNCIAYGNGDSGFSLGSTLNTIIENCSAYNNDNGIFFLTSSNNTITNCTFYDNIWGVYIFWYSLNNTITNCNVYNNNVGIYFRDYSSNNRAVNCNIYNDSFGVFSYSSTNNLITSCNIYNNDHYGISSSSSTIQIHCNNIYGNTQYGIYNADTDPSYETNATYNYWGHSSGPYHPTLNPSGQGDNVSDNVLFTPWLSGRWYGYGLVHDITQNTWYGRIQDAIDNASNGDIIFVYSGTYYENVLINKSINLIGENKNATIIDGNSNGDVVYITTNNVSVSNFTIRNSGNSSPDSGIRIHYNGMSNCSISYCNIYNNYYGICFWYWGDKNIVHDCNIFLNNWTGILIQYTDENEIYNCNIYSNEWSGISVASAKNNTIYNCRSYKNLYGVGLAYATNTTIYSCNISSNDYSNVRFQDSYNNSIFMCKLTNCSKYSSSRSVYLHWQSYNNSIYLNIISNNRNGIYSASNCYNNKIFHNDIINNTIQALDYGNNTWDNGYPMGGNHWSNYDEPSEGAYDNDSDGIIDTSYNIAVNSSDNYPLTNSIFASIPFMENFSATVPPAGWMDTHSAWLKSYTNYSDGISPEAKLPYNKAVDGCMLYTPPIDTTGYNALVLRFKTFVDHWAGTNKYTLHVMISKDTINWKDAWNITPSDDYGPSQETILLSENDIGSYLYISFVITGDPWYLNYWYVDDVELLPLPSIVYVDDDFNETTPGWNYTHFNRIQDGINGVAENGIVYVYNGIYNETPLHINKTINIIGEDKNATIIQGGGYAVVFFEKDNIVMRNVKIKEAEARIFYVNGLFLDNIIGETCRIYLQNANNCTISNSSLYNASANAIDVYSSKNIIISYCRVYSNNRHGIYTYNSTNNTIIGCQIYSNAMGGIHFWSFSYNNTIVACNIYNNSNGIYMGYSANNTVYFNTISNNSYGVNIRSSNNNIIFHNNFINNTIQAYDNGNNTWDNGYPMGGNYWNDYTTPDNKHGYYQNMSGFDLIVDYPYNISGGSNRDRWPHAIENGWMKPLFTPNVLLVEFKQNVSNSTINNTIANYGTEIIEYLPYVNVYLLNITADNQSEFDTLYMFQNDTNVLWACLDLYTELAAKPEHLTAPNDQCYPKQWHLNNYGINPGVPTGLIDADIDAPQAWEHLTDCRKDWNGNDFVIAIIDTGVDLNHPDIMANLWTNPNEIPGNNNDDDNNGIIDDVHGAEVGIEEIRWSNIFGGSWFVTFYEDGSPDDEDGHGTHCAGIICAEGNNGIGVTGVCWKAQLMVLKGVDVVIRRINAPNTRVREAFELATLWNFERCINYILDQKNKGINVKVVSFSAAWSNPIVRIQLGLQNAINRLNNAGILFVCAAGNDGRDLDDPTNPFDVYPAECPNPNIIAVAASDNQDRLASFSNWGTTSVDIVAPGQDIFSLGLSQRYNEPECIYRDIDNSGTVSAGDIRLSSLPTYAAGTVVGINDADVGLPLINFNADEKHDVIRPDNGQYDPGEYIYRDIINPANNVVDVGDVRLTTFRERGMLFVAGSIVGAGDPDVGRRLQSFNSNEKHTIYCYMSGTSMATPMVTGTVAHLWCQFPNLNHLQVKEWLLKKVDPRATLQNTVTSGKNHSGRLRMISGFDFGDAPDPLRAQKNKYPTILDDDNGTGASHEDIGEEWLGWDVSPEYDANVVTNPPYDVDGLPNLWPPRIPPTPHPPYQPSDIPDLDAHDDGVAMPIIVFPGGTFPLEFHIQTENPFVNDADDGRYDEFRANKRNEKKIYINAYFDWNQDGDWDDVVGGINEHLIKCPAMQCTWWGGPGMNCSYGIFWPSWNWLANIFPDLQPFIDLLNENAYRRTTFTVPWNAELGETWVRVRLDYGEDAGHHPPYPRYDSKYPFSQHLSNTYSHAQYGEVEDYWLYIINKTKVIGEPSYYDGETTWITSYTPISIIDEPEPPYPVLNYYRLWYDGWTPWMEYNDTFYLEGEGLHYIEYYGRAIENNRTIFYDDFNDSSRWATIDLDGSGYTWQLTNTTPDWLNETVEGHFMLLDQYAIGELEIPSHDSLISSPISCQIFNNTMLYFNGSFKSMGNEKLWLNISSDYGGNWTNILTLEENSTGPWLINISSIADGNIIVLNFTYSSPFGTGYGALIDDVYIYGDLITYSPIYNQSHIVDDSPPTATINAIAPYVQETIPFEITYNASDEGCGLKEVWLYFRYSPDNSTWSEWLPYAKSNNGKWLFHAPYAPAYYEFYSDAIDNLNNSEGYDGIEARAYVPIETLSLPMERGWNLITIASENNYTASSLMEDMNGCSIILSWNASLQDFIPYIPGSPYDFEIENGHGYFIAVDYSTYFATPYIPIESVNITLLLGWNALGWFKEEVTTARSIHENISHCSMVLTWNASSQDFIPYIPGSPYNDEIYQGDGFFVAVSNESQWHGEG